MTGSGCGQILGADDYEVARDDGAGGEAASGVDAAPEMPPTYGWFPGVPDEGFVDRCAGCAKDHCLDERNLCLDPAHDCWERLECASVCDDPDCLRQCGSKQFVAGLSCEDECAEGDEICRADCWEGRDRFSSLRACLVQEETCGDACNTGLNYDCVGNFEWLPGESQLTVRLSVTMLAPDVDAAANQFPGLNVVQSDRAKEAEGLLGIPATDEDGEVDFRLDTRATRLVANEFTLFGQYPAYDVDVLYKSNEPLTRSVHQQIGLFNYYWNVEERLDPALGLVSGSTLDCLGFSGLGLRVELEADVAVETAVWSFSEFAWVPGAPTGATNLFQITEVPEQADLVRVVARRDDDGTEVASAFIKVYAGWITRVMLHPDAAPY